MKEDVGTLYTSCISVLAGLFSSYINVIVPVTVLSTVYIVFCAHTALKQRKRVRSENIFFMKKDKEKACNHSFACLFSGYRQVASQLTSAEWLTP